MSTQTVSDSNPLVSVIVAVYQDVEALRCVLWGLEHQSEKSFEVIVTEDGCCEQMRDLLLRYEGPLSLRHLTQEDRGFRKTTAVNRAIVAAESNYLIFLDGDTIPHYRFVEMHWKNSETGKVCAGRRMHLGPLQSSLVRANPDIIKQFESWPSLLRSFLSLHRDNVRNYEIGSPWPWMHSRLSHRHLNIVGCNFSCFRKDILAINGYDESLTGVGGEDCDLEWRFNATGVTTKNIKFLAIAYHLYHESRRADSDLNLRISSENKRLGKYFAETGISQHQLFRAKSKLL